MQITVAGRHMDVSPAIRQYAEEKIGKVAKIHDRDEMLIEVVLHEEQNRSNKNRDVAEVTARMKGLVVRAEEAAPDMHSAIDLVSEKLERQMVKYKTKLVTRRDDARAAKTMMREQATAGGMPETREESTGLGVVRTKTIDPKPMTEEEAIMQLELLGHDFFVYRDAETNACSVLYRRNVGGYGLLQSE